MDRIVISCRPTYCKAREYIYDVIFLDFWGIDYVIQYDETCTRSKLTLGGIVLEVDDTFFQQDESHWLQETSLPLRPLQNKKVPSNFTDAVLDVELPIIYGDKKTKAIFDGKYCSIDVFGAAFFMMTRYEEHVKTDRDVHGRFPGMASLAYQEGFLERPIINEYLELFWQWMKHFLPHIKKKSRNFRIMPTHDCDSPFWSVYQPQWVPYRSLLGDVVKRRDFSLAWEKIQFLFCSRNKRYEKDPYNIYSNIMDLSEKRGLRSTFFFMTTVGRDNHDGNYSIVHPFLRRLIHDILKRGHNVGIHPGYGSSFHEGWIQHDIDTFQGMLRDEKLVLQHFGGRQHYLQWKDASTWKAYAERGMEYDTSLSYADHIGFRCGICYDYPVFNVITNERYALREYPLEIMECSGLDNEYMNLSNKEMIYRSLALKKNVRKYQGVFVVLWHNTRLLTENEVSIYTSVLDG